MGFGRGIRPDNTRPSTGKAGEDPFLDEIYGPTNERSSVVAFVVGGVVIAGGLLTLLYFGNDPTGSGFGQPDGFVRMEHHAPKITGSIDRPAVQPAPATH